MLSDELKPHFDAIKKKLAEHGHAPHASRVLLSLEAAELQTVLFDKREKYLAETLTPVKDTILVYLEGDKHHPVRRNVLAVTAKHIVADWHEAKRPQHHFSLESGYSLERPNENGRRNAHVLDRGELSALKQGLSSFRR